jgi:hypothetical protein
LLRFVTACHARIRGGCRVCEREIDRSRSHLACMLDGIYTYLETMDRSRHHWS